MKCESLVKDSRKIAEGMGRESLLSIYETMLTIRAVEDAIAESIERKEIGCPCHLYSGEEAVATGVCSNLNHADWVYSSHRSHGHYLAKGGDLGRLMAEVYCREPGCSMGRGGSMHLSQPEIGFPGSSAIVAGSISLAVGSALAFLMEGKGRVAVTFFGDGAVDEGVFYESLNLAALYGLPVLFVCENNLYSTHMPIHKCIADTDITKKAHAMGVPGVRIDGNDAVLVHEVSKGMIEEMRAGGGPFFLECMTYRHRGHVGPNHDIEKGLRSREEFESWMVKDPIKVMSDLLIGTSIAGADELDSIAMKVKEKVGRARHEGINAPWPDLERESDFGSLVYRGASP